jgi:hypothetical protein
MRYHPNIVKKVITRKEVGENDCSVLRGSACYLLENLSLIHNDCTFRLLNVFRSVALRNEKSRVT